MLLAACSRDKNNVGKKTENPFYTIAAEQLAKGQKDSAFSNFNKAKDWYHFQKDSSGAGVCIINMALISTDLGDRFGGQELSLEALKYFDENNIQHYPYLLSIYNNLGIASSSLKQYPRAIEFYTKSLQFIADSSHARVVKNNIANTYRRSGKVDQALEIYSAILEREDKPINRARILSNYAYTRFLSDPQYPAEASLREALRIRLKEGDIPGQVSSYGHLADYYQTRNRDSAIFYSARMYHGARGLHAAQDQMEALQKLIPISPAEESKKYFARYRVLEDSLHTAWNSAKNQFAVIRYETEKHKADKLVLQQEKTVRNSWIISLAFVLITGGIGSTVLYKRRVKYLALKAANDVRASQLKTSKKVHDVVANGLYKVMSEVEHSADLDREKVLDDLESLYEKSRDISYDNDIVKDDENFGTSLAELITSFATSSTKVLVAGNSDDLWRDLNINAKNELKYVLQELMVNMTKHSNASSVAIRFERISNTIGVHYTDNGRGISENTKFNNGLTNTGNRIKSIGGTITFEKGDNGGLHVEIRLPSPPPVPASGGNK